MAETPDWLQSYAKQQGWGDTPQQPDPNDIAELQAYADRFAPKQPKAEDIAALQGTAAALEQPTPIVDPETGQPVQPPQQGTPGAAHVMLNAGIPALDEMQAVGERAGSNPGSTTGDPRTQPGIIDRAAGSLPYEAGRVFAHPSQLPGGLVQIGNEARKNARAYGEGLVDAAKHPDAIPQKIDSITKRLEALSPEAHKLLPGAPTLGEGSNVPATAHSTSGNANGTTGSDEDTGAAPAAPQGHWVNGQWVRTVSPTALGMEGKLELNRGEHAANEADAARALSLQREQIYNQRTAEIQAQVDAARAEQMRTTAARDKADKDYEHAQQVASEAKIDTSKVFSDGGKAAAILGVALGAVGSAILKTPNEAAELVKSHIEQELSAQKTNAANTRDTANNAWARLRAATGSAQQADSLYRIAALQTYQAKLDEMNAGPQQRAAIDSALEQAKDTQQARALQFRLQTEKYSPGYMVGGGAPAGGAEADPEKVVQMGHESVGGYAPNTRLVFGKKEDASAVTDQMQAYGIVQKARDRIAAIEKANPLDIYRPGSEAYEDAKQIRLQAVTQVGHLNGVKKLPIFDAENMNDALDTHMYNAVTGASATHRMDTYLRNAKDALDESVQTRAPEVVRRHLDVNQRGEVTPGNHYTGENIQRAAPPPGFHVRDKGVGTQERAPLQYKPEIRHVTETPGKGKKKKSETVTSVEPEEDEEP